MRNSTKHREKIVKTCSKKLGIFSKIFGMRKVQLARIKGVYSKKHQETERKQKTKENPAHTHGSNGSGSS